MRTLGLVSVALGVAALAGTAVAAPIPPPPLPTPTVTVPPLPVNPPPIPPVPPVSPPAPPAAPKLPPPVAPAPVTTAPPAAVAAVTHAAGGAVPATAGSAAGGGSAPGAGSPAAAGAGSATGSGSVGPSSSASSSGVSGSTSPGVDHFHSSRMWIGVTGSKRRQTTTLTFVLQRGGRVVFLVNQVAPACTSVGRFVRLGHAGLNRVRFDGVVRGRQLTPGTYRIAIRTARGRVVRRVTLVVVGGSAPSTDELRVLRSANTCPVGTAAATAANGMSTFGAAGASGSGDSQQPPQAQAVSGQDGESGQAAGLAPPTPDIHTGVLASSIEKTARAIEPLLVALLAASIVLLGLASLPREAVPGPRMHEALARHRLELAGLGAMALVAVAIAFLVT